MEREGRRVVGLLVGLLGGIFRWHWHIVVRMASWRIAFFQAVYVYDLVVRIDTRVRNLTF